MALGAGIAAIAQRIQMKWEKEQKELEEERKRIEREEEKERKRKEKEREYEARRIRDEARRIRDEVRWMDIKFLNSSRRINLAQWLPKSQETTANAQVRNLLKMQKEKEALYKTCNANVSNKKMISITKWRLHELTKESTLKSKSRKIQPVIHCKI